MATAAVVEERPVKSRTCDKEITQGRLAKANGFLAAADDIEVLDDAGELGDAIVTLLVHAGIAAADVICCVRLGHHAQGEKHAEAIALLNQAERDVSKHLGTLLRLKTKAGYSHEKASTADQKKASRAAHHLVEAARSMTD